MPEEVTLPVLIDLLSRGSVTVLLAVMFWFLATDRLVTKGRLEDCQNERDRLLREEVEARERAERRLREVNEDRVRIIADRDRLRKMVEDRRRKST
jgi:hypothetical protein